MIREGKKLPKGVLKRIPVLVRALENDPDVVALFAFGSLACNALKPLSDLDFGILLDDRLDRGQRIDKHIELIGLFNDGLGTDEIDLVNMNDASGRVAFQILKTGKLLACKNNPALIDFRERVVKKHLDFKCKRDAYDAVFLKGVGYHGLANYRAAETPEQILSSFTGISKGSLQ